MEKADSSVQALLERINGNSELQEIVFHFLEEGEILLTEQLYFKDQIGKDIEDVIHYFSGDGEELS
jgi:hypothetical protein